MSTGTTWQPHDNKKHTLRDRLALVVGLLHRGTQLTGRQLPLIFDPIILPQLRRGNQWRHGLTQRYHICGIDHGEKLAIDPQAAGEHLTG